MPKKYVLMPDEVVSAAQLIRLYRLRPGEFIDASRPYALRGYQRDQLVPLYPIYDPQDDGRKEIVLYEQWAERIESLRGTDQLWNPAGDEVPEYLMFGEPYRR